MHVIINMDEAVNISPTNVQYDGDFVNRKHRIQDSKSSSQQDRFGEDIVGVWTRDMQSVQPQSKPRSAKAQEQILTSFVERYVICKISVGGGTHVGTFSAD